MQITYNKFSYPRSLTSFRDFFIAILDQNWLYIGKHLYWWLRLDQFGSCKCCTMIMNSISSINCQLKSCKSE